MQVSKLRAALILRLTEQGVTEGTEAFVDSVLGILENIWDVSLVISDQSTEQLAPDNS